MDTLADGKSLPRRSRNRPPDQLFQSLFIELYLVSYNCRCSRQLCQYSSYFLSAWHPLFWCCGRLKRCTWFHPYCFLLQGALKQTKKDLSWYFHDLYDCCHLQNTTPMASLRLPKWPFPQHYWPGLEQPFSIHDSRIQIQITLWIVQKRKPLALSTYPPFAS